MRIIKSVLIGASVIALAQSAPAFASESSENDELRAQLKSALDRVEALERRIWTIEQDKGIISVGRVSDEAQAEMRGRGVAVAQASAPASPASSAPPATQQGAAAQGAAQDAVAAQSAPASAASGPASAQASAADERKAPAPTDAVETLTRSEQGHYGNRFTLETGFHYSRFSGASLNLSGFLALDSIFLGLINIDELNADVFTTDVTARLGVTRRLQFDVNAPYLFRRTNFQTGGAGANASGLIEKDLTTSDWGDMSFGMSWRVMPESFRRPDVVLNLRGKAPTGVHPFGIKLVEVAGSEGNLNIPARLSTGTGTWGISGGMSILKTIDPMVVFASANYFHNFPRHFADITEIPVVPGNIVSGRAKFGDALQIGAGVAFALNEKSSLSTSFTQRIVARSRTKFDGGTWEHIVGSQANVSVLNFGATFGLTKFLAILTNVGVGITPDAPDMTVSVRLPWRF